MSRAPLVAGAVAAVAAFAVVTAIGGDEPQPRPSAPDERQAGAAVFARLGCGSCHRLAEAGSRGGIGPDLDGRLAGHTAASLAAVITDPPAYSMMPADYGARLSDRELEALTSWLLAAS